tara:strand:+ start:2334 stop:2462 length:129 start_codon:yes stop_codon:yes gene_type:complete
MEGENIMKVDMHPVTLVVIFIYVTFCLWALFWHDFFYTGGEK